MEKFRIEKRDGYDHIINLEHNFTLRVIPPEKQDDCDYIPYQVVGPIFVSDLSRPELDRADFETEEEFEMASLAHLMGMDIETYDFEGLDISYSDDDVEDCNKAIWLETVNHYCALKLGKTAITLRCYGYQYEFSELNCTPELLHTLNGGNNFDINLN